jgi:zinc protease
VVIGNITPEDAAAIIEKYFGPWKACGKKPETLLPPDELRQAKALLLRKIPLSESSVDDIAQGLIYRATHELTLDEQILAVNRYMKLTAEQVKEACAKWLRPDGLVKVTEGPSPQ